MRQIRAALRCRERTRQSSAAAAREGELHEQVNEAQQSIVGRLQATTNIPLQLSYIAGLFEALYYIKNVPTLQSTILLRNFWTSLTIKYEWIPPQSCENLWEFLRGPFKYSAPSFCRMAITYKLVLLFLSWVLSFHLIHYFPLNCTCFSTECGIYFFPIISQLNNSQSEILGSFL